MSDLTEARRRAVEAAANALWEQTEHHKDMCAFLAECAVFAAERAMADAGWRWAHNDNPAGFARGFIAGQAAASAAMLGAGE